MGSGRLSDLAREENGSGWGSCGHVVKDVVRADEILYMRAMQFLDASECQVWYI